MGYCGCATKTGKVCWLIVAALAVLCVLLQIGGWVHFSQCEYCVKYTDGSSACSGITKFESKTTPDGTSTSVTTKDNLFAQAPPGEVIASGDLSGCTPGVFFTLLSLSVVAFFAAFIPCCVLCCCASPPAGESPSIGQNMNISNFGNPDNAPPQGKPYPGQPQPVQYAPPAYDAPPAYGAPLPGFHATPGSNPAMGYPPPQPGDPPVKM